MMNISELCTLADMYMTKNNILVEGMIIKDT